ncbi:MAG: excinuclease ABC subunit UvrB [Actinomycetota bacterium]
MDKLTLVSPFNPTGDQPQAIRQLKSGFDLGYEFQTLLGVTGSGKTFTMANLIEQQGKPALVIAPNKTLAAQLASEFKEFFPSNAVEYFVSYYDYYQPEAYVPQTDTYIEKDSSINDEIDRLRHAATSALFSRRDVVIVASVSCIYGLGSPEDYLAQVVLLNKGRDYDQDEVLNKLIKIRYNRNDYILERGTFRLKGDVLEVFPAYQQTALRVAFDGDTAESIEEIDPLTGKTLRILDNTVVYPASHFITAPEKVDKALASIEKELNVTLKKLHDAGKLLEAQRLKMRTEYDLEMLREVGYCNGIENYSRHFSGRAAGEPPDTLLSYFPKDFLTIIDESHITVPQLNGMYRGDKARKETLIEFGFRLPSALDNRPLRYDEFIERTGPIVFTSATPADYEKGVSGQIVEQIIRPTGLVDPEVIVRPTTGQVDDLMNEVKKRTDKKERVLVTTLTKKMAEDLTDYLTELGLRVQYLHSDVETLERVKILTALRRGEYDCLVGINLLREGLDLPEVSLVLILDADKEGFLRSETSLIQTIGRAARNVDGQVIMYADNITASMGRAISETNRRRKIQVAYNKKHGIKPETIRKAVNDILAANQMTGEIPGRGRKREIAKIVKGAAKDELEMLVKALREEMLEAASGERFEDAARLRDEITLLEEEYGQVK